MGKKSSYSQITKVEVDEIIKDRISDLPDDILSSILSLLMMKETTRTSSLSHRWKYLWRTSISSLNFDVANMIGSEYFWRKFRREISGKYTKGAMKLLRKERCKFVKWVDQILQHHQRPEIDVFRVRFYLDKKFACQIDQWIRIAIAKRVQKLDLNLSKFDVAVVDDKLYDFPYWLFAQEIGPSVKHLYLKGCILSPPLDFNGFSSIIVLTLEDVDIAEEHIVNLLSNSSNLERLSVVNCLKLVNLKITGPSLKLKFLNIACCKFLLEIEIFAIYLTTFEYSGAMVRFSFMNVPRLVNAVIHTVGNRQAAGVTYALGRLASDLPLLESLSLFCMPIKANMIPERLPVFTNLKRLVLDVSWSERLLGLLYLIQASPHLYRLEVLLPSITGVRMARRIWKPSKCTHHHLKEVELNGFRSSRKEMMLAKYLLSNAKALKTMTIHQQSTREVCYCRKLMLNAENTREQLEKVRPPGVQLTID